ncbi:hypothetical protein [Streptomyces lavendulocolor]|uniref:hypothetical protein n=1 Tax=Streptomyces lavendulocolor TaxID=67316 RepID=UPI0033EEF5E2
MTNGEDPSQSKMDTAFRSLGAILGVALLVLGAIATFRGAKNSEYIWAFFVLALILLVLAIGGRVPSKVSFGKDLAVIEYLQKAAKEGAEKGASEAVANLAPEIETHMLNVMEGRGIRLKDIVERGGTEARNPDGEGHV